MNKSIILGARASTMAQIVAHHAKALIEAAHSAVQVEVRGFASGGDKITGDLKAHGGKGLFVNDLEQRLLNREIDCAIHALKDIPGDVPQHPDLMICSFLARRDARDALIMRQGLAAPHDDAAGIIIGTSSPRRAAQLRKMYQGVEIVSLRGNVDSRLRKLQAGVLDGMVLSVAGLNYLNATSHITKIYEPEEMLPAIGQGVLCLQIRREDFARCPFLRSINVAKTEAEVAAERALLLTLQGNCHSAIAGYCTHDANHQLQLTAAVYAADGMSMIHCVEQQTAGITAEQLGYLAGNNLLAQGAKQLIAQ
jgi:hydroxymethylbilane synthase